MKQATELTNGEFFTVKDEKDLKEKWLEKSRTSVPAIATSLIPMAFPIFSTDYTPCSCHN